MIHEMLITADSQPAEALKLFRKLLMTGGAVVELDPNLTLEQVESLIDRFVPIRSGDLAATVRRELAATAPLSLSALTKLLQDGDCAEALVQRKELDRESRARAIAMLAPRRRKELGLE